MTVSFFRNQEEFCNLIRIETISGVAGVIRFAGSRVRYIL
jgi:hypothetical protein